MRKNMQSVEIKDFINSMYLGFLATNSQEIKGYPFGSLVPYVCIREGALVIMISRLAQHWANLSADPRCSVTIPGQGLFEDPQQTPRITVLADAWSAEPSEFDVLQAAYRHKFPDAVNPRALTDFAYWKLSPIRIRTIGGFGDISWQDPETIFGDRAD